MKYYSEITGKTYSSEEECVKAEEEFNKSTAVADTKDEKAVMPSKKRKELADEIKKIESEITEAEDEYRTAQKEAQGILDDARKQADALLEKSRAKIREKKRDRMDAIMKFNKEFGVYTRTYTGVDALREYEKAFEDLRDHFFSRFWF